MFANVHNRIIASAYNLEVSQLPISWWMNYETVLYEFNGILLGCEMNY